MASRAKGAARKPRPGESGSLLLVEDDVDAIEQLNFRLKHEGYSVTVAKNAAKAAALGANPRFDIIIMDYFLPDGDGEQICRQLRNSGVDTPILMLTARGRLNDKISAFDHGADDYLTKPFAFAELFARLRALTRRGRSRSASKLTAGRLILDREARMASFGGHRVELSPREFELLAYLMTNANRTVTRQEILAEVWSTEEQASTNTIDVYIRYLRQKIWGSKAASPIRTLKGTGYHFHI